MISDMDRSILILESSFLEGCQLSGKNGQGLYWRRNHRQRTYPTGLTRLSAPLFNALHTAEALEALEAAAESAAATTNVTIKGQLRKLQHCVKMYAAREVMWINWWNFMELLDKVPSIARKADEGIREAFCNRLEVLGIEQQDFSKI